MMSLHERMLRRFPYLRREDTLSGLWYYHAVTDTKLCDLCDWYANIGMFPGAVLKATFPFMTVVSDNEIQVNVHPSCRCYVTKELTP